MLRLMLFVVLPGVAAARVPAEVSAPLRRGLLALFEFSAPLRDK